MQDEEKIKFGAHPKIYHYDDRQAYALHDSGVIEVQEKFDGSQISWKVTKDRELLVRSKGKTIDVNNPRDGWGPPVSHLKAVSNHMVIGYQYYGEYISKPKHNCLTYGRAPKNNIILFGAKDTNGRWLSHKELIPEAMMFGLEVAPLLHTSSIGILRHELESFLGKESMLGGCAIEGVVMKNLDRGVFCKLVDPKFKEKMATRRTVKKRHDPLASVDEITEALTVEARWEKAYQYLRDNGDLTHSHKDIGLIVKRIHEDLLDEEQEFVKNRLFEIFGKNIFKNTVKNVHQWYKDKLKDMEEGV